MNTLERFHRQLETRSDRLRVAVSRQATALAERSQRLETLAELRDSYVPATRDAGGARSLVHRLQFMSQMSQAVRAESGELERISRQLQGLESALSDAKRQVDRVRNALDERDLASRRDGLRREQRQTDEQAQLAHARTRLGVEG